MGKRYPGPIDNVLLYVTKEKNLEAEFKKILVEKKFYYHNTL